MFFWLKPISFYFRTKDFTFKSVVVQEAERLAGGSSSMNVLVMVLHEVSCGGNSGFVGAFAEFIEDSKEGVMDATNNRKHDPMVIGENVILEGGQQGGGLSEGVLSNSEKMVSGDDCDCSKNLFVVVVGGHSDSDTTRRLQEFFKVDVEWSQLRQELQNYVSENRRLHVAEGECRAHVCLFEAHLLEWFLLRKRTWRSGWLHWMRRMLLLRGSWRS
ncbi:unnamed protein product [Lactuca virosa]|uniref:Uncharacterized protein n=1 Tax=Lactuca virosa TaxID=75947 RepID=A0AAU9PTS1_9ASTR|nr:unnamed protein product [Lactuca virosa]